MEKAVQTEDMGFLVNLLISIYFIYVFITNLLLLEIWTYPTSGPQWSIYMQEPKSTFKKYVLYYM